MLACVVGFYRPIIGGHRAFLTKVQILVPIVSILYCALKVAHAWFASKREDQRKTLIHQLDDFLTIFRVNLEQDRQIRRLEERLKQEHEQTLLAEAQTKAFLDNARRIAVRKLVLRFLIEQRVSFQRESAVIKLQYYVRAWEKRRKGIAIRLQAICRRKLVWLSLEDHKEDLAIRVEVTKQIKARAYKKWVNELISAHKPLFKRFQSVCRTFLKKRQLRSDMSVHYVRLHLLVHYSPLYTTHRQSLRQSAQPFTPSVVATNSAGKQITIRADDKRIGRPAPISRLFNSVFPNAEGYLNNLRVVLLEQRAGVRSTTTAGSLAADCLVSHLKQNKFPKMFCLFKGLLVAREEYVFRAMNDILLQPIEARTIASRIGPVVFLLDNPNHLPFTIAGKKIRVSFGPRPVEGLIYAIDATQVSLELETWTLKKLNTDESSSTAPFIVLTKRCCDIVTIGRQGSGQYHAPPMITPRPPVVSLRTIMEVEEVASKVEDVLMEDNPAPLQSTANSHLETNNVAIYEEPNEIWGLLDTLSPSHRSELAVRDTEEDWLLWLQQQR